MAGRLAAPAADGGGGGDQPFMVCSLPLVFCEGRPVALENMSDRNLVNFVRFMLKCAMGVTENRLKCLRRPAWWPRTVPYFNLNASSEVDKGHAERLRELVRCCYRGADCEYLLRFSADIERHCTAERMAFKNNFDGTSSLYELSTNRLVVTCRNQNLEYDRPKQGLLSPRRHLLPKQLSRSSTQTPLAMVQPPTDDIFLCDTCSAEFSSVDAVQAHERQCGLPAAEEGPPSDTESLASEPEVQCASQSRFLSYVGLAAVDGSGKEPYSSPTKRGGGAAAAARLRRGAGLLIRYPGIDVASPLGRRLGPGPPPQDQQPPEHEKYCEDSERKRLHRQPAFPISWRPPRKGRRIVYGWSHRYCFTAAQRAERRRTIRYGLTDQARRLVQTVLPCSVKLTRATEAEITEATRPRPRPPPVHIIVSQPTVSMQQVLWRPTQSLVQPPRWGRSRAATSALVAAAAAGAAGAGSRSQTVGASSALRDFRPSQFRPNRPPGFASASRAHPGGTGSASGISGLPPSISLPPGLSITPQRMPGTSPPQAAHGPVWRSSMDQRGGNIVRLVRERPGVGPGGGSGGGGGAFPAARATASLPGGTKMTPIPKPATATSVRQATGQEVKNSDAILIDLCSSSDDEGDPPPAAPPPRTPPARIKLEAAATPAASAAQSPAAAASTNGTGCQSKNAHSHWSRSCGGLANGVSTGASPDAGPDTSPSGARPTAADHSRAAAPHIRDYAVTSARVAMDCSDDGAAAAAPDSAVNAADHSRAAALHIRDCIVTLTRASVAMDCSDDGCGAVAPHLRDSAALHSDLSVSSARPYVDSSSDSTAAAAPHIRDYSVGSSARVAVDCSDGSAASPSSAPHTRDLTVTSSASVDVNSNSDSAERGQKMAASEGRDTYCDFKSAIRSSLAGHACAAVG